MDVPDGRRNRELEWERGADQTVGRGAGLYEGRGGADEGGGEEISSVGKGIYFGGYVSSSMIFRWGVGVFGD